MKKYLLLSLSILSIFFINNRVEALSFENGTEVDENNFIYYIYSKYPDYFDTYNYFSFYHFTNDTYRILFSNSKLDYFSTSTNAYLNGSTFSIKFNSDFSFNKQNNWSNSSLSGMDIKQLKFANFDVMYRDLGTVAFTTNITKQNLTDYFKVKKKYKITYYLNNEIYKEIEVEEGSSHTLLDYEYDNNLYVFSGWTVDDNKDLNNITDNISIHATLKEKEANIVYVKNFPEDQITKSEFYTLLILISILIMLIFLRWCFPFKGGKDLK